MDGALKPRLNTKAGILVVGNGVINQQTGELRHGRLEDYMSRQLSVQYNGLDSRTDEFDRYIGDLLNDDKAKIEYLQRTLGYGITGDVNLRVWRQLNRRAGKSCRISESRRSMCLPILLCNHLPEIDVNDKAMRRRMVVVPFNNVYTSDPDMETKMLSGDILEQFLVWLVRGAVAWYKNKDLENTQPPSMLAAFSEYIDENDHLQQFIDEYYELDMRFYVNASIC
ncbi:hypothetical protein BGZ98_003823 [Dissophora globulifera]|nr:hypothetical protein BGZ98_003823 [Dissophora globulifera]